MGKKKAANGLADDATDLDGDFIGCSIKKLPDSESISAASIAKVINPANAPALSFFSLDDLDSVMEPGRLAIITNKYWGSKGVDLSYSFMESRSAAFRKLFDDFANLWGKYGNIRFRYSESQGDVRVAFEKDGYWSYLGTDIKSIPFNQPTMNLQGFTENTELSEWERVVVHEVGHTLGCPHEHARPEIVALLDPAKVIAYFKRTQGWNESTVRAQILTSLKEASIIGSKPEIGSIMCYDFPASVTKSGQKIVGGTKLTVTDQTFIGTQYPKSPTTPTPPPVTPTDDMEFTLQGVRYRIVKVG